MVKNKKKTNLLFLSNFENLSINQKIKKIVK